MKIIGKIKSAVSTVAAVAVAGYAINYAITSDEREATAIQCSALADAAGAALSARHAGLTLDGAMDVLRSQKIYSGPQVWAVKQAYKAPADTSNWVLTGTVMAQCQRDGVPA